MNHIFHRAAFCQSKEPEVHGTDHTVTKLIMSVATKLIVIMSVTTKQMSITNSYAAWTFIVILCRCIFHDFSTRVQEKRYGILTERLDVVELFCSPAVCVFSLWYICIQFDSWYNQRYEVSQCCSCCNFVVPAVGHCQCNFQPLARKCWW